MSVGVLNVAIPPNRRIKMARTTKVPAPSTAGPSPPGWAPGRRLPSPRPMGSAEPLFNLTVTGRNDCYSLALSSRMHGDCMKKYLTKILELRRADAMDLRESVQIVGATCRHVDQGAVGEDYEGRYLAFARQP